MAFCSTLVSDAGDCFPFLALERPEGAIPLGDSLADNKRVLAAPGTGRTAASGLEKALAAVHACGVAHGDVNGRNVLATNDGRVWLFDMSHAVCGVQQGGPEMAADDAAMTVLTTRLRRLDGTCSAQQVASDSSR